MQSKENNRKREKYSTTQGAQMEAPDVLFTLWQEPRLLTRLQACFVASIIQRSTSLSWKRSISIILIAHLPWGLLTPRIITTIIETNDRNSVPVREINREKSWKCCDRYIATWTSSNGIFYWYFLCDIITQTNFITRIMCFTKIRRF